MDKPERKDTAQRALVWVGIALGVVVLLVLIWYGLDVVLLAFLGVLLAILLRAPADWLARKTGIGVGWTLAFVCLVLLAALSAGGFFFGREVMEQSVGLSARIPEIIEDTRARLRDSEIGRSALQLAQLSGASGGEMQFLGKGLGLLGSTFGALANVAIVLFFAVFLAAQPKLYIDGLVHLVARPKRARVRAVLHEVGDMLRRWVVAQSLLALAIATLIGAGLLLIGAPFALPLALLAGVMEFVPYIGPLLAAVPAVLVGFAEGTQMVGWIAALYLAVQAVESYVLSPIVQHKAVYLAPALILFAQVLLGVIAGGLGVAVATPLAAALMVAINKLYVEDVLGEHRG
ncbi:MAG TPA: AI-2E family transporter [Burkholderiales bacterium]